MKFGCCMAPWQVITLSKHVIGIALFVRSVLFYPPDFIEQTISGNNKEEGIRRNKS
jgi:hypothetical protein